MRTMQAGDVAQRTAEITAKVKEGERRLLSVPLLSVGGRRSGTRLSVEQPVGLRRLSLGEEPPAGHRLMRVPTEEAGDERYSWDATDVSQINEAKAFFDRMVALGMVPYRVDPRGRKTPTVMRQFDAAAEEVLFAPINVPGAVAGG